MNFHTIAGLPRSGSTLIANALAQHPDVYVSGTSPLPVVLGACTEVLSNSPEVVSMLANVSGSQEAFMDSLRGLIEGWYGIRDENIVIDKGRGWAQHALLLQQLYPDAKMVVCVRDPRDVVASIERQHRKTAVFQSPTGPTLFDSASNLMSPEGMVGGPIRLMEDLVRRNVPNVIWMRYESLIRSPRSEIEGLYTELGLEGDCDIDNIENQAPDLDALYRFKYLHDAAGPIKSTGTHWSDLLDPELASLVAGRYPFYMHTFNYEVGK